MKAIVIGRNGQVAYELLATCPKNFSVQCFGRHELNVMDAVELAKVIGEVRPEVIINASAYTAVDKAETEQYAAFALNRDAVANIATVARENNIRLLHISTDFVFDGTKTTPYEVNDTPNPVNIYGESKLAGEKMISEIYPGNSAIIRTSWVYSTHGNNFVKTMLRLMSEKESLSVVSDQIGSPTYAKGLAVYLWQLAEQESLLPIYHYSDLGVASWYDFAMSIQEIAFEKKLLSKKIPIYAISSDAYPTQAKRPAFSLLNKENTEDFKYWRVSLKEFFEVQS
ncbi:TPA: dTDP-4-dehydrorhamnose reductase [Vibrio vulnificus]